MKPPGSVPIDKGTKTNKNETEETCIMLFEREVPTKNPKLRTWSASQAWEILATGFYAETDGNSVAEVWGERGAGLLNEDIPGKNQYASHLSLLYWLRFSDQTILKCFVSRTWCAEKVNITAYNVEGDPLVRGTDYEASWLGL